MCEIGSSAGLNLRMDLYAYRDQHGELFGDGTSALVMDGAWNGRSLERWPSLEVADRVGSDLRPVDVGSPQGRLLLTAYVWPDQRHRLERLRAAFRVADRRPAAVHPVDARTFVDRIELRDATTTVLFHSVMWQYLPRADQEHVRARLDELGRSTTGRRRLAHLRLEPERRRADSEREFLVSLTTWPGGESRVLGVARPHGVPVTWA